MDLKSVGKCGGCINGKHIRIVFPANTRALYRNYKNFYSVVVMAVVNSNYEFIYIDVGKQGRFSDGGVMKATSFFHKLKDGTLHFPENEENDEGLNFVFVADEAFSLYKHIIKPYYQKNLTYERRIYNYRLSRARNVVENAFGIMSSRFKILQTDINLNRERMNYVVSAICVLHNFLRKNSNCYK